MATYGNPIVASPNMIPSTAEPFNSSKSYNAGAWVWYSGQLYEFISDHAAGVWVGTDAEAVKIGDEVADLKSAVSSLGLSVVDGKLCVTYSA